MSQLVRFACVCDGVFDFKETNLHFYFTGKLLHHSFRCHRLVEAFSKFYHRCKGNVRECRSTCGRLVCPGVLYPIVYVVVLYRERWCRHSHRAVTRTLDRLVQKATVLLSGYWAWHVFILVLIHSSGLCNRNKQIYSKTSCWHDTGYVFFMF